MWTSFQEPDCVAKDTSPARTISTTPQQSSTSIVNRCYSPALA